MRQQQKRLIPPWPFFWARLHEGRCMPRHVARPVHTCRAPRQPRSSPLSKPPSCPHPSWDPGTFACCAIPQAGLDTVPSAVPAAGAPLCTVAAVQVEVTCGSATSLAGIGGSALSSVGTNGSACDVTSVLGSSAAAARVASVAALAIGRDAGGGVMAEAASALSAFQRWHADGALRVLRYQ